MWLRFVLLSSVETSRWIELDKHLVYPLIYYPCVPDLIFWCAIVWCIIEYAVHEFVNEVTCLCIWQHDLGCEGGYEAFWQWELPNFFFGGRLGISCFVFCGSPIILLVLPSDITIYFPFLPILVILGRGHIHSALDSISSLRLCFLHHTNLFPSGSDLSFLVCLKRDLAKPFGLPLVIPGRFLREELLARYFLRAVAKEMLVDLASCFCASQSPVDL